MADDLGSSTTNGTGDGESLSDLLDGQELGTLLMGQLDLLVESWAKVIETVAEHGIDPTPLLKTLAHTLRATADQLDPS
jgi:hypothetical protein